MYHFTVIELLHAGMHQGSNIFCRRNVIGVRSVRQGEIMTLRRDKESLTKLDSYTSKFRHDDKYCSASMKEIPLCEIFLVHIYFHPYQIYLN